MLSGYGRSLRKTGESNKFIDMWEEINGDQTFVTDKYVIDVLCWCTYDVYIKEYSSDDLNGFGTFISKADFIVNNCKQLSAEEYIKNPYVITIKKVVKIYNERTSKNYKQIIKWLSLLTPEILSDEVFNFVDQTGKDRELASTKEFYYQNMAKSYEKTEQYEPCIIICENAFKQIKTFHYRNQVWLKARMYFCKCMIQENIEEAIVEYRKIAYRENFWFMYHKLSQISFRYNKLSDALFYASKAYDCRFEYEKMVNLLFDTAVLWQALGNNENAKLYYQASAYYRKQQGWNLSDELNYATYSLEIDVERKPDINILKNIAKKHVESIEVPQKRQSGSIKRILPHGGSGFIKTYKNNGDIYFNMKDVVNKEIVEGDFVDFELKEYNNKSRAINIMKRGESNGRNIPK